MNAIKTRVTSTAKLRAQRQFEYECECGYFWIDNVNPGCPMCSARENIVKRVYTSIAPEAFEKHYNVN